MELNLPAAGEAKAQKQEDIDPSKTSDTEVELPSELTVVVKTQQDGVNDSLPSHYLVEGPQVTTQPIPTLQELQAYLVKARSGLTNQDDVKIRADSRLKYAYIMEVMDVCSKPEKDGGPGFKRVGFAPPPDLESSDSQ
jgi:biopolymer transport protein ExbD